MLRAKRAAPSTCPELFSTSFKLYESCPALEKSDLLDRQLGAFSKERYGRRALRGAVTVIEPGSGRVLALASYPSATDLEDAQLSGTRQELLRLNHNFLHHPVGSAAKPFLAAATLAVHPALSSLEIPCFAGGEPPRRRSRAALSSRHEPPVLEDG